MRRGLPSLTLFVAALVGLCSPRLARADEPTAAQIEAAIKAGAERDANANAETPAPIALPIEDDAPPPPRPRKRGIVLEGSLGAMGFYGQFRHVAPMAPWLHAQLGYELLRSRISLMVFGEGELAFTDTSEAQDPSKSRAFPIFGFGAGARGTFDATARVSFYLQASLGALKADVPKNAFTVLGYSDAESLGLSLGGRVGVEWYQLDRHLALGLAVGLRDAMGFAKVAIKSDTPLMGDYSAAIRYVF